MTRKKASTSVETEHIVAPEAVLEPEMEVATSELEVVEQIRPLDGDEEQVMEQQDIQPEAPLISMNTSATRQTTVWGPFPPPLGSEATPSELDEDPPQQTTEVELTPEEGEEQISNPLW